ncbi:MAG: hypothetical protein H7249_14515 [Chitinophagaceae bacterium]|nr:hypothetical protein [Oligoflexus sp.]
MKTPRKIVIAVGMVSVLGFATYLGTSRHTSSMRALDDQIRPIKPEKVSRYTFHVETRLASSEPGLGETSLLAFEGVLDQFNQGDHEFQSEWSAISRFTMRGIPLTTHQIDSLVHNPMISIQEYPNFVHLLPKTWPIGFETMQLNFLQKFFPPVDLNGPPSALGLENDEFGQYNVKYQLDRSAEGFTVLRTYSQMMTNNGRFDTQDNTVRYNYSKDGTLTHAEGEVDLHLPDNSSVKTYLLIELSGTHAPERETVYLPRTQMSTAAIGNIHQEVPTEKPQSSLMSMDAAFTLLDKLDFKDTAETRTDILHALIYDLYYNPEHIARVREKILSISGRDEDEKVRLSTLCSALAATEISQGAEVLASLAKKDCPDDFCRDEAAFAYGMHNKPTPESAQSILEVAERTSNPELASTAYLASGSAGSRLGDKFTQLPAALDDGLKKFPSGNMHNSILLAMGNHGDQSYYPALKNDLHSVDSDTRAAAAYSLRSLPNDSVNTTLLDMFDHEANFAVSLDIMRAMFARNFAAEEYIRIAKKAADAQQAVQESTADMLLQAYGENHNNSLDAIKVLRAATKLDDVKAIIDEKLAAIEKAKAELTQARDNAPTTDVGNPKTQ